MASNPRSRARSAASEATDPRFLDPALDRLGIRSGRAASPRAELLTMYRAMRLARTFEQKLVRAVPAGQDRRRRLSRHGPGGDRDRRRQPAAEGRLLFDRRARSRRLVPARRRAASTSSRAGSARTSRRRTAASWDCFSPISSSTASRRTTTDRWRRGFRPAPASRSRSSSAAAARLRRHDRRRRHQSRRLLRGLELRRHSQAAAGRHRREQLLRLFDAARTCRCRSRTSPIARRRSTSRPRSASATTSSRCGGWRAGRSITRAAARARISSSSRHSASAATASTTTWPTCRPICASSGSGAIRFACCRSICEGEGGVPAERRRGDRCASAAR